MTKAATISCFILMVAALSCRNTIERDYQHPAKMSALSAGRESLVDKIQGIWGMAGNEAASFVIRADEIIYPDIDAGYRYYLKSDSIKIKYDEDERAFALHVQGPDTLILTGHEKRVYYRYKE